MDALTLDFSKYYNDIINALKEVYGHEYGDIIEERFKDTQIITYANKMGMYYYHKFLQRMKSKELCIKFLERIGIDTSKFNITSYADDFSIEIKELIKEYLDCEYAFELKCFQEKFGSFDEKKTKCQSEESIIDEQIDFINFLRKGSTRVTKETYDEFKKTKEYEEILNITIRYNEIYDELSLEMSTYLENIKKYMDYYNSENERWKKMLEKAAVSLYSRINYQLPEPIMNVLNECATTEEAIDKFFGTSIVAKLYLEYFGIIDEMKLQNESTSKYDKDLILRFRMKYFKNMGIDVNPWEDEYYEVIKRDDVKSIIPSYDIVSQIQDGKKIELDMANFRFICENDTFIKLLNYYGNTDSNKNMLYEIIVKEQVCNVRGGTPQKSFIPIIFLTMRDYQGGIMDYIVLHELIHAIESQELFNPRIKGDYRCGFEPTMADSKLSRYHHRKEKRKYERLNENITDMFTAEARDILHKKGIYIMEPKEHTKVNEGDHNTFKTTKEMLKPFLEKYRPLIINARICGTLDRLKMCIREDNFEELNDIIDRVDSLCERGLEVKINSGIVDDYIYKEYMIQLKRLERVYASMEECYRFRKQNDNNIILKEKLNMIKKVATDDNYNDYKGRFY